MSFYFLLLCRLCLLQSDTVAVSVSESKSILKRFSNFREFKR